MPIARQCDFPVFDADNHLYETQDAFTRHLPKQYKNLIEYVSVRGRTKIVIKGQISNCSSPPGRAGAATCWLRGTASPHPPTPVPSAASARCRPCSRDSSIGGLPRPDVAPNVRLGPDAGSRATARTRARLLDPRARASVTAPCLPRYDFATPFSEQRIHGARERC